MPLAKNIPKAALLVEAEGAGYFFIGIFLIIIILGMIYDPSQMAGILSSLFQGFISPALAFIDGLGSFAINLISGIIHTITSGVSQGASNTAHWLWNHTFGAL